MRPKYLVGIIIGVVLIYMSVYGTGGLGWYSWTGGPYPGSALREDFAGNSGVPSGWTPLSNPDAQPRLESDQLKCQAVLSSAYPDDRCGVFASVPASTGATYTLTIRAKVASWGSSSNAGFAVAFDHWQFWVFQTHMCNRGDPVNDPAHFYNKLLSTDNLYHTYTFCVTKATMTYDFYVDQTKVDAGIPWGLDYDGGQVQLQANEGGLVYFDYIILADGLVSPVQLPPSTYQVSIYTQDQANNAPLSGIRVTASDSAGPQQIYTSGGVAIFTLKAGDDITISLQTPYTSGSDTYNWASWIEGGANPLTISGLSKNETRTALYNKQPPPPPPNTYILTVLTEDTSGIQFATTVTFNSVQKSSGSSFDALVDGTYSLSVPSSANSMNFDHWSDSSTEGASRQYHLSSTTTLIAFYKTTSTPPSDGNSDILTQILAKIKEALNSTVVRELELAVGGLMMLGCVIGFFLPSSKRYYYAGPA